MNGRCSRCHSRSVVFIEHGYTHCNACGNTTKPKHPPKPTPPTTNNRQLPLQEAR